MKHAWLAAAAFTLIAQSSFAGVIENKRLPDANYQCSMWSGTFPMIMGDIRIRGLTFQGPAFDNKFQGGPYPYVLSGKVVLWKGPLGGLSSGGNQVGSTVVTNNDPAKAAFDIIVMTKGGNTQSVNCSR
ncbi:MAG TPA: hypothetical protein VGC36_10910 [Rhizomicrobium sp.]